MSAFFLLDKGQGIICYQLSLFLEDSCKDRNAWLGKDLLECGGNLRPKLCRHPLVHKGWLANTLSCPDLSSANLLPFPIIFLHHTWLIFFSRHSVFCIPGQPRTSHVATGDLGPLILLPLLASTRLHACTSIYPCAGGADRGFILQANTVPTESSFRCFAFVLPVLPIDLGDYTRQGLCSPTFWFVYLFETRSHYLTLPSLGLGCVDQPGLEFTEIHLSLPSVCWD